MSAQLLGLHQPGTTLLHRLPAGAKLLALMAAGLVVVVVGGPTSAVAFVAVATALLAWSGARLGLTLRAMRIKGIARFRALYRDNSASAPEKGALASAIAPNVGRGPSARSRKIPAASSQGSARRRVAATTAARASASVT